MRVGLGSSENMGVVWQVLYSVFGVLCGRGCVGGLSDAGFGAIASVSEVGFWGMIQNQNVKFQN